MYVNSALVSAQNRERFYVFNWDAPQPEDRGIRLVDILENATTEKAYKLYLKKYPIATTTNGKSHTIKAQYYKNGVANFVTNGGYSATAVAVPVRIGTIENSSRNKDFDSQQYRVYSPEGKSVTICGNGGGVGAKTGLYAVPNGTRFNDKISCLRASYYKTGERNLIENLINGKGYEGIIQLCDGKTYPAYEVTDGLITIKDKTYPINLPDGHYIIRKLTPVECERLQTMPDNYTAIGRDNTGKTVNISNSQRYKCLGNGWTAEVIKHLWEYGIGKLNRNEPIEVLSMYDGIATARYVLESMGFTNIYYKAYEIDKYAIQVAQHNYPDIIQCGDAFQVRDADWSYSNIGVAV